MDTKLNLTFYDVISHLFPGAAFLLTLYYFSNLGKELSDVKAGVFLLVFGFLAGLILHMLGLLLFKTFFVEDYMPNSIRHKVIKMLDYIIAKMPLLKVKNPNLPIKDELIKAFKTKLHLDLKGKRLGLFSVADTFVASLPYAERDILLAKEGLFRSLTALVVVETIYFCLFVPSVNKIAVILTGILLTELFRYGREYYRTIKNQQIYTLALIKLKQ